MVGFFNIIIVAGSNSGCFMLLNIEAEKTQTKLKKCSGTDGKK